MAPKPRKNASSKQSRERRRRRVSQPASSRRRAILFFSERGGGGAVGLLFLSTLSICPVFPFSLRPQPPPPAVAPPAPHVEREGEGKSDSHSPLSLPFRLHNFQERKDLPYSVVQHWKASLPPSSCFLFVRHAILPLLQRPNDRPEGETL